MNTAFTSIIGTFITAERACVTDNGGCLNGATCVEAVGAGRSCQCVTGYRGDTCQVEDQCTTQQRCSNDGVCIQYNNGTFERCDCSQTGFKGPNCATGEIIRTSNYCVNASLCIFLSFTVAACGCHRVAFVAALSCGANNSPCLNGGTCMEELDAGHSCLCAAGFTGPECQTGIIYYS